MAEFNQGDSTDAILLFLGPLLGFNPTSSLTNVQTQANALVNGSDVQTWITKDFSSLPPPVFIQSPLMWVDLVAPLSF
jgi:hypothetical protein